MAEEETKQEKPKIEVSQGKSTPSITSPEAVIMFPLAIILDLLGYVLLLFALDDFWLMDIVGLLIIGSWVFIRSGGKRTTSKKGLKNFGVATVIEMVPYVGSISPSWSVMVYKELKNNP